MTLKAVVVPPPASADGSSCELRRALATDEYVESWCSQVSVAGSVDEVKVEVLAAVVCELGRQVGCDEDAPITIGCELILGDCERDCPIDRLDPGNELEGLSVRRDPDCCVCASHRCWCVGKDRRLEPGCLLERGEGLVQDSEFSRAKLRPLGHGQS
jgi:hypothetical protein